METAPKMAHPPGNVWMSVASFDGKGNTHRLTAAEAAAHEAPAKGFVLIAGRASSPEFRDWLRGQIGDLDAEAMLAADNRTRCIVLDDKALVLLAIAHERADGGSPHKQFMAIWIEAKRVIIASDLKVMDILNIERWQQSRHAPLSPADLVARLGLRAADRLEPVVERLGDQLDRIEETIFTRPISDSRKRLTVVRHNVIAVRRMLYPQRDVLDTLEIEDVSFFTQRDRTRLREASARLERLGGELQGLSERAVLVHEQIIDTRAEQMNRTMLVLTAVTVILLPLTVISGVLGMNVAGIPFSDNPYGFWLVSGGLSLIGITVFVIMRRVKWL